MYNPFSYAKNNYMLDIKSKLVLKILQKECPDGSYKIVESKDIISSLPAKFRVDSDGLDNILIYLERQEYISIKYDDDGVYCLCVLPFGNEILENETIQKKEKSLPPLWLLLILIFLTNFISSFFILLINKFLF